MTPEAEVKCVYCKHKWWVGPSGDGDMPGCPKCHGFGVSTGRARVKSDPKKKGKVTP